MPQKVELNFRDYWRIGRRRRWIILGCTLLSTLVSFWFVRQQIPIYQAVARIKVEQTQTLAGALLESALPWSPGDPMENYAKVIESRPIARRAAERLGLLTPAMTDPAAEAIVDGIHAAISTERVVNTNLIQIFAEHTDPEKARDDANAVAESFVEWDLLEKNKQARKAREFIEGQLEDVQKKLHDLEERLAAMKGVRSAEDKASPLTSQLASLKAELAELSQRATDRHPRVVGLKEEIRSLEGQLAQLPEDTAETEYTRLARDVALHEQLYRLFKQKFEEAKITEAEKISDVSIVDYARLPTASAGGGKATNTLLGGMIGLLMGCVIAFVVENLDTSISTIEDVEGLLAVPVLTIVPNVGMDNRPAGILQRFKAPEKTEASDRRARLIVHHEPKSPIAEAYRTLRTNLKLGGGEKGRSLVITSTSPREGKSTVLVNLGLTTAQIGSKTLLVESDMRRPTISKTFQITREPGLNEVITGGVTWQAAIRDLSDFLLGGMNLDEAAKTPGLDYLFILTCGKIPLTPSELLASEEMGTLMEELRRHFDVILYDAPPVLPITDAALLAPLVDGTLLVYEVGRTARSALVRAKGQIESVGGHVLGVVLNHIRAEAEFASGYRYYYHYKYYGREKEGKTDHITKG